MKTLITTAVISSILLIVGLYWVYTTQSPRVVKTVKTVMWVFIIVWESICFYFLHNSLMDTPSPFAENVYVYSIRAALVPVQIWFFYILYGYVREEFKK